MAFIKSKKLFLLIPTILAVNLTALYFWIKAGWMELTIIFTVLGIGMILLFYLMNKFYKYLQNSRCFLIICATLVIFTGLYCWINEGDTYTGIFITLIGMILICAAVLAGKWKHICCTVMLLFAVAAFIFGEIHKDKTHIVGTKTVQQQHVDDNVPKSNNIPKGKAVLPKGQQMVNLMYRIFPSEQRKDPMFQKLVAVMASDSFQEQLEQKDPKTLEEFYQILVSQGGAEIAGINFDTIMADGYKFAEEEYNATNPGKDPETEEDVMAHKMVEAMEEFGLTGGMNHFLKNQKNAVWISVRFKGDGEMFHEWMKGVGALYQSRTLSTSTTDVDISHELQQSTSDDEILTQSPFAETETASADHVDLWEETTIGASVNREVTTPPMESEIVAPEVSPMAPALSTEEELETTLSERISKGRFDRAMETLERYGPEEGLRRLREDDPEVAKQMEQQRVRQDSEESER